MTFTELKDKALQIIDQYSVAGSIVPPSYNNQQDYINRIPGLINDAEMYLASGPRRIEESVFLDPETAERLPNGILKYALPDDFLEMMPRGLLVNDRMGFHYETRYTRVGDEYILISEHIRGDIRLCYYRKPRLLPARPTGNEEIDNTLPAQSAIPYYVAAFLIMADDAFLYTSLYNEWQVKVSQLAEIPRPEREAVADVYGMEWAGDYC